MKQRIRDEARLAAEGMTIPEDCALQVALLCSIQNTKDKLQFHPSPIIACPAAAIQVGLPSAASLGMRGDSGSDRPHQLCPAARYVAHMINPMYNKDKPQH